MQITSNLFLSAKKTQQFMICFFLLQFFFVTPRSINFELISSLLNLLQGPQPVPGQIKYKSTMKSIVIVAREEGFAALYKGLLPKVMRLGPGGAIMLLVYEYAYEFLQQKFP